MSRRYVILLIAGLIAALAVIASLVPRAKEPARSAGAPPTASAQDAPRTVLATLPAAGEQPRVVRATVGDLVRLTVVSTAPDQVDIPGFDRVVPVEPATPARLLLAATRAGSFPVRLSGADRQVGTLVIGAAPA